MSGWQHMTVGAVILLAFCSQKRDSADRPHLSYWTVAVQPKPKGCMRRTAPAVASARAAEEVSLAELDAVVTQDRVRGGHVEEHVRNRPVLQEFQTLELERAFPRRETDVAALGVGESQGRHAPQIVDGARDACAQLLEAALVVGETRRLLRRETRHGV